MKTALEMYQFCKDKKYGKGWSESKAMKSFGLIEKNLAGDEDVGMCFVGKLDYTAIKVRRKDFAFAVTHKRIILAQKKIVNQSIQSLFFNSITDVAFSTKGLKGFITILTNTGPVVITLGKGDGIRVNSEIHELIYSSMHGGSQQAATVPSQADELGKLKDLLDKGAINQEEFDIKKKQILGI